MMTAEYYMERCIQLARNGAGKVAPNPMVGAVLVYDDRIIGEGWHQQYGGPHAEVNCINSVQEADKYLISSATIYVSLEPCAHFGKTPPCADLIIRHRIPKVVIGCRDPFDAVNGKGIEKLEKAGIAVTTGVLEAACLALNERFFTYHLQKRPFIILKWAQTADGFIARDNKNERLFITHNEANTLVHKWRSEEAAILVGTRTAQYDDPSLTTRLWPGASPVRLVIDRDLQLPGTLKLFDREHPTIVFNVHKQEASDNLLYYKIDTARPLLPQITAALYHLKILSVIVEGGTTLLQSFVAAGLWDEARVITNIALQIGSGLAAPVLTKNVLTNTITLGTDIIHIRKNTHTIITE